MRRMLPTVAISVLAGAALSYAAFSVAGTPAGNPPSLEMRATQTITAPPAESVERVVPQGEAEMQLSFAPVVRAVAAAVVNVYATTIVERPTSPFMSDPFFQRFFGGEQFHTQPRESQSLGSGVIVDASGIILTNHHVIQGATDIRISTSEGREYAVDLILDDSRTDLAVLKIRDGGGQAFPALPFGDSDSLEVGDLVLAIGNPFGVGQTVTSGIVSALARTGVESNNYEFFIQTDAAINPGNSGGALVDLNGRLVGINTAIFSQSGGSVGIGFAIPSSMGLLVAETAMSGGALVRPWFGARLQAITSDIADSLGLETTRGALVTEIAPDSSAARAGFRPGDAIVAVDGFPIDQPSAFDFRLATHRIGESVTIDFVRDGQQQSVSLALEAAPGESEDTVAEISGNTRFAGTRAQTISPSVAQELGLPFDASGVVVRSVEPGSPAQAMGLQAGDIILSLNGEEVTDAQRFAQLAADRPRGWDVVLQRGGRVFRSYVSG